jgi:hypothetical protein
MDRDQIQSLIAKTGRGIVLPAYAEVETVHSRVAEVRTVDATTGYEGHADDVMEEVGSLTRRADGQAVDRDRPGRIGIAPVRFHKFARGLRIPVHQMRAIMESPNPEARLVNYMQSQLTEFGRDAARGRDIWLSGMLEKGVLSAGNAEYFDNSYAGLADPNGGKIYDKKAWFATDHPLRSGTRSNLRVTSPLTLANLDLARIQMRQTNGVNHRGNRIQIVPDTLIVPSALESTAIQLVGSQALPGTAQNDVNPQAGRYQIVVNPYLESSDGWFLAQARLGLEIWSSGAPEVESGYDFETREFLLNVECFTGGRVTNWRGAIANNYAAS